MNIHKSCTIKAPRDADGADIDAGWGDYYLGPIKELLEGSDSGA